MSKFGTKDKCETCEKTVYPDEKIVVDGHILHTTCFRCKKCNNKLTLGNYAALEGAYYCKPHFKEAFKLKGKYDFGGSSGSEEKPTSAPVQSSESTPVVKSTPAPVQSSAPAPSSGGPPPPPGPPPVFEEEPQTDKGNTADLFAAINAKRDNAGSGLRKVKDEEKTKNRSAEEKVAVVPDAIPKKTTTAPTATGAKKQAPPKFELSQGMGEKWMIENQIDAQLEVSETKTKQGVYIFNCKNTWVTVKGKVNNVILDKCVKSGVILDDAVASVEMVNCQSVKVQINGSVPTINIDKVDGAQVFLSEACLGASIITSKSSEMNIMIPGATEDDDMIEVPVPEQFQHKYNPETKKLETEQVTLNL